MNIKLKPMALLIAMALTPLFSFSQEYCTPPNFITGPFTGMEYISLNNMQYTSSHSDGYADFTQDASECQLKPGETYTLLMQFYYDPALLSSFSGRLNFRVWVDFNQDWDFEDANETLYSGVVDMNDVKPGSPSKTFKLEVTVPADAKLGGTRMRIYNDMLTADGHITPNPCGYLNDGGGLGQHGECEDYAVMVSTSAGVSEVESDKVQLFPNPSSETVYFSEAVTNVSVSTLDGKTVLTNNEETKSLDISDLEQSIYILTYTNKSGIIERNRLIKQ